MLSGVLGQEELSNEQAKMVQPDILINRMQLENKRWEDNELDKLPNAKQQ